MNISTPPSLQDALSPQHLDNPYLIYQRLRENDPVYWDNKTHAWIITGYEYAMMILRDARCSSQRSLLSLRSMSEQRLQQMAPVLSVLSRQMIFIDPPDHTRLRRLVNKAFTPARVEMMRAFIQQLVNQLLDTLQEKEHVEIVNDFAFPIPATVIAQLLGVPTNDQKQFATWTDAFGVLLDGSPHTEEEMMQALSLVADFLDYFRHLIAERRNAPQNDLIQALLVTEEQGEVLSEEEIIGNCLLLFAAGHGTTIYGISNGLFALLQHPDQLRAVQSDPSLMTAAVQELLRYESPVQVTSRQAREAFMLGNRQIAAGDRLIVHLGAVNHDPAQFQEPDQLDVRRFASRNLAFGHGIHFCLGSPLALLEIEIALTTLLTRFPKIQLTSQTPQWHPVLSFRHLVELPVNLQ
ncbi:cytochrome P450 [Ktedonosporobacter rubrisoli]|uniref:Cytochrome P450 n=1 Tax=Ktedonosporobacter rubrisoli TaxID=2509675 RepID=A0A4P6JTR1_KTERU|nr:cytochrome P450 [Ktedonosporobacter rubrisoli]QBD78968.1 cytochrome P450 [Ktedonosporobacter rubrisoli]